MSRRRWLVIISLAVFLLAAVGVAVAVGSSLTIPLTIKNNAGQFITVKLNGPQDYSFSAPPNASTKFVQNGLYRFSYSGCGDTIKGSLETTPSGGRLVINVCRPVNLTIVNNTGDRIGISLVGPRNYFFSQPEGRTVIRVLPGVYDFTGYYCNRTKSGSVKVSGGKYWTWECPE